MIGLLLTLSAYSAEIDRYPWMAELTLPEEGVARVRLPPELRSTGDPSDGSDVLLLDGDGKQVPVAVLHGEAPKQVVHGQRGTPETTALLVWWPAAASDTWIVDVRERPLDGLQMVLPDAPIAATAVIRSDGEEVARGLTWNVAGGSSGPIAIPPLLGELEVQLLWHGHAPEGSPQFHGVRLRGAGAPEEQIALTVSSMNLQEDGWARYDVPLPGAMPLSAIVVRPAEPLFDRKARALYPEPLQAPGTLPAQNVRWDAQPIRRLALGGATVEQTQLTVKGQPRDRVAVLVASDRRVPLQIDEVTAILPGRALLIRNPGPGPHTLYAGAQPGTTATSEVQFAAPELAREAGETLEPGPRRTNPVYQPPEVRGRLGLPSEPIELKDFRFGRSVTGPAGLTRLPLDEHVLTEARGDLADLRLVDAAGNQIPYLLQSEGVLHDLGDLPVERSERDGASFLEVTLPQENLHIGTVTLHTEAPLFKRRVSIERPRGGDLQTLRVFHWVGEDRPTSLTLDVHQRFGDRLVVRIENGDNPPLPVDAVQAAWPAWSVLTVLPADGARLVYGDPRLERPDYDLFLLGQGLDGRAADGGSLGAVEELTPPPLSFLDRALVFAGVGALGFGLLLLTLVLLRGVPEDEAGDPEAPETAPEPA